MLESLVGDVVGTIHLIAAVVALISGSLVIGMNKGTRTHVRIGYVYVGSMIVVIVTAFGIYRLFDGWGMFHYMTVVSLVTLAMGMIPILLKRPEKNWRTWHFSFMFWSVIGLYAAFASEILTRIPDQPWFGMLNIAIGGVMLAGGLIFKFNFKKWEKVFRNTSGQSLS